VPSDPKAFRQYAWRCSELAYTAKTPELKSTLIELSKNWLKLAIELERSHAILEMHDPPPPVGGPRKTPA